MESLSEFTSDEGKVEVSRRLNRWILCTPKTTGTPQAALRSKVLDPCTLKRNRDAVGGFAEQSA